MSDGQGERNVVLPTLVGAMVGFVLVGCFGGAVSFTLERKLAAEARRGWNLVPVVVAAVDLEPNTEVTMEVISQRSLPEQFVTSSVVKPDSASYIINQRHGPGAYAGDLMLWSAFETQGTTKACAEVVTRAVEGRGRAPSAALSQLVGALAAEAAPRGKTP